MEGEGLMLLNAKELCDLLQISESTLRTKFKRTQENAKKDGYIITKKGRGKSSYYEVIVEKGSTELAETIFQENKEDIKVDYNWLHMSQVEFNLLLMLLMCPMKVYRGTYSDMCKYLELSARTSTFNNLKEGIISLANKNFIGVMPDEDIVTLTLKRDVERNYLNFDSELMRISKSIAADKGIRSWISVMKVWLAVRVAVAENVEKVVTERLQELTGLSGKTVVKCLEGLAENNVLKSKKIMFVSEDRKFVRCVGKKIELNGFYN